MLSRLSPSGFVDALGAVFSGDALEELQEIADDIRTVLHDLKRQADARQQSMQDVMQLIDDAVVSLEQKARSEFTHYLGDDVGNAVATAFDFQLNMPEGIIKGGIGALEDLQQLNPLRFAYDFEGAKDTWDGMLETNFNASAVGSIINPERAAETQKGMLKGLVHAQDWTTARPGLGLGENMFDVGSALFGGAGAARTGTRAAAEAADAAEGAAPGLRAAGALDNAVTDTSAIAGRAGTVSEKLDNLGDNIPTGVTPNTSGPSIPPSLSEPPSAPRVLETPGPRVPDAPTPVERSPTVPHSSTPTSTPTHSPAGPGEAPRKGTPPIGAAPESRVPTAVEAPSAPHQSTATLAPSAAPSTGSAPPIASHTPETPPSAAPHGTDNGNPVSGRPHSDAPNNPPHTGLHDPPANHATPGAQLPDLTDINKEYRLPNGAVDPDRFDEWTEKIAEAYPTITKDGVEGVYDYTTHNYQGINPYLRNLDELSLQQSGFLEAPSISEMTDAQRASWEAQIQKTDEAWQRFRRIEPIQTL